MVYAAKLVFESKFLHAKPAQKKPARGGFFCDAKMTT